MRVFPDIKLIEWTLQISSPFVLWGTVICSDFLGWRHLFEGQMSEEFLILFCVFSIPLDALAIGALVAMILQADDFHFDERFKRLPCVFRSTKEHDSFRL